jgi:hypothetical protein
VTLSYNDFPSRGSAQLVDGRGAIEQNVLAADQAVPELDDMQDAEADPPPVPGRSGSDPMTVPVISCWRIIASFVV